MLEYVKKAPSLFGVRGTPVLLVMSPDGSKVDTLRGYYTGQNALYFDQIKNSVKLAKQQYEEFKKTLIPKGYRSQRKYRLRQAFPLFGKDPDSLASGAGRAPEQNIPEKAQP